jgi:hypothetical protein
MQSQDSAMCSQEAGTSPLPPYFLLRPTSRPAV